MGLILIRYGEIGLKSRRVRTRFELIFKENIKDFFIRAGLECIIFSDWGRIYLQIEKEKESMYILKHIFGIVSLSLVVVTTSDLVEIVKTVTDYSRNIIQPNQTFAIRVRRTGDHNYTSMQVAQKVGEAILNDNKNKMVHVNLKNPDVKINIEIRKNHSYLYKDIIQCAGGLPIGTQGKVIAIFNDDYCSSAVAAWLIMKRGCRVYILCNDKNNPWISEMKKWDVHLHIDEVKEDLWKTAVRLTKKIRADGLVTACGIEPDHTKIAKEAGLPIFYPLIGLTDVEIKKISEKIKE